MYINTLKIIRMELDDISKDLKLLKLLTTLPLEILYVQTR